MKLTINPIINEQIIIENTYMTVAFFPITLDTTVIVATLVAGPANRNTKAAPGESPFSTRAAAMGVEAVAHTYNGVANTNMKSIEKIPDPK